MSTTKEPVPAPEAAGTGAYTWTGKSRRWFLKHLPPDKLLPEDQPSYVASWAYVFGMGAVAGLVFVIASGFVLALNGPEWYHVSSVGHFVNSMHLWSVELFFMFLVVHLWIKFWMAAWRGGRILTWITSMVAFLVSVVTAFTGYLLQTNFDSQWIAYQAKDALNAVGVGAWFNVANVGQIFMWHIGAPLPRLFWYWWPCILPSRRSRTRLCCTSRRNGILDTTTCLETCDDAGAGPKTGCSCRTPVRRWQSRASTPRTQMRDT